MASTRSLILRLVSLVARRINALLDRLEGDAEKRPVNQTAHDAFIASRTR